MRSRAASGLSASPARSRERAIAVSITDGQTAFTRTPRGPSWSAADFVMPTTACLLAP